MEVQGAQGRVEDPCPIRVLLWLQGGSQGHSSLVSDTVSCSSIGRAQRSANQGDAAFLQIQTMHGDAESCQGRTTKVQGAQGRVEDPCPIRVLLWLQGGSQGHSSLVSDTVSCSSIGRAQRSANQGDAAFLQIQTMHGDAESCQGRTTKVQGAQGRVEDPCPIRVLLWLKGGSQGNSSRISDNIDCSSRWSANII